MKLLKEIPSFPNEARRTLESEYGIETAEAFYAHAVQDPEGMQIALHASKAEIDRLAKLVEGNLPSGYAERCRQPATKHPRGVIWDH